MDTYTRSHWAELDGAMTSITTNTIPVTELRAKLIMRLATLMSDTQRSDSLKQYVFDRMSDELQKETDLALVSLLDEFLDTGYRSDRVRTAFDFSP